MASNFANEYYDYRDGLDRAGRDGPRRGVTEGDITPGAMLAPRMPLSAWLCCVGLSFAVVGRLVASYCRHSHSDWRHGLQRRTVSAVAPRAWRGGCDYLFGVIPVNLTYYVQSGYFAWPVGIASAAIGLMGANVLLVNNYRDADDDAAVGKRTLAVIMGRGFAYSLYLINGVLGMLLLLDAMGVHRWIAWVYLAVHLLLCMMLKRRTGRAINPLLGMTAVAMLAVALAWLVSEICSKGV